MTEHLTDKQLEHYRARLLRGRELLAAGDHLAACAECRRRFADAFPTSGAATTVEIDWEASGIEADCEHLDFDEQLAPYVEGSLDEFDRAIVESHIAVCSLCAADARDLAEFKVQLDSAPSNFGAQVARRSQRARFPAAGPPPSADEVRFPIWSRSYRRSSGFPPLGYTAGIAAALIVVALVAFSILQRRDAVQEPGLTRSTTTPAPSRQSPASEEGRLVNSAVTDIVTEVRPDAVPTPRLKREAAAPNRSISATVVVPSPAERRPRHAVQPADDLHAPGDAELPQELRASVAAALSTGRVESAALEGIAGSASVTLKGIERGDSEFEVLSPVGTIVRAEQPTFRWQPVEGATGYAVTVVKRGQIPVVASGKILATEWQPPVGALRPGVIYRWGVVATLADGTEVSAPGPTAPEARFGVLEPSRVEQIERLAARLKNSPLALGVLYAREGLIDDAEREFRRLATENPRSRVARRLLESVRKLRTSAGDGQ